MLPSGRHPHVQQSRRNFCCYVGEDCSGKPELMDLLSESGLLYIVESIPRKVSTFIRCFVSPALSPTETGSLVSSVTPPRRRHVPQRAWQKRRKWQTRRAMMDSHHARSRTSAATCKIPTRKRPTQTTSVAPLACLSAPGLELLSSPALLPRWLASWHLTVQTWHTDENISRGKKTKRCVE